MNLESMERTEFLLAMRATEPLTAGEERELSQLLERHPQVDPDSYDLAAATVLVAALEDEPMPPELKARLTAEGERLIASRSGDDAVLPFRSREASAPQPALLGWLAAAACLLLAILGWWPRFTQGPPTPELAAPVARTADDERARLLSESADVQQLAWTATEDPAAVAASGDVVWSPSRQQGFMRIRRLEANQPTASQYQLWIFDRARDERYPVDGGVFDIPAGDTEVVVPIDARIQIKDPYLFAVTVEPPGGVVVSDRERIVLVAQVAA